MQQHGVALHYYNYYGHAEAEYFSFEDFENQYNKLLLEQSCYLQSQVPNLMQP